MQIDENELENIVLKTCRNEDWHKILYAGIVGSAVITNRKSDVDVICITSNTPEMPCTFHTRNISLLVLTVSWLNYDKHFKQPTGLVPSVLFKSIELSQKIIGAKDKINLPKIAACRADWVNIKIKKKRYEKIDRKNYLIALLFERLLKVSPDLSSYNFDNIEMARKIGADEVVKELTAFYRRDEPKIYNDVC